VILSGHWAFVYAAVGAYNVGSIKLDISEDKVPQSITWFL